MSLKELATRKAGFELVLALSASAVFIGWLGVQFDYLVRVWQGPEPVSQSALIGVGPAAYGRWFDVKIEGRTGHLLKTTIERRKRAPIITNHFAVLTDPVVIVETPWPDLPTEFYAWASEFNIQSDYYRRARKQLDKSKIHAPISPVLLRTSGNVQNAQAVHAAGITLTGIVLALFLARSLLHLRIPARSPPVARLKQSIRSKEGISSLSSEIDLQFATRDWSGRRTGAFILPSWLVFVDRVSFALMSASDAAWIRPVTHTRKLLGLIPISKSYHVLIYDRHRRLISVEVPLSGIDLTVEEFRQWAPWAVIGPDPSMEERFAGNWWRRLNSARPSRTELMARIDKRREEIVAHWASQAAARQGPQEGIGNDHNGGPPSPHNRSRT